MTGLSHFEFLALILFADLPRSPVTVPEEPDWILVVKSCRLPGHMPIHTQFAHHTWIDAKCGSEEDWMRIEVHGPRSGVMIRRIPPEHARERVRWKSCGVSTRGFLVGATAKKACELLEPVAKARHAFYRENYRPWPGPNSNTFIREISDAIPELVFAFHHNAVGQGFTQSARIAPAPSRTGWRVQFPMFGITAALREGIQVHFLGLTAGRSLLPPRRFFPCLPVW